MIMQSEDRDRKVELFGCDDLEVAGPKRTGESGEARAHREGEQLRRDQIDAHRRGCDLVLPHGRPRAADPRCSQPSRDEHRQHQDRDDEVVPGDRVDGELQARDLGVTDRVHALGALGDLRRVLDHQRHDLAEPERDDREVVAAQAQCRRAE